jgi:hypothetical protein
MHSRRDLVNITCIFWDDPLLYYWSYLQFVPYQYIYVEQLREREMITYCTHWSHNLCSNNIFYHWVSVSKRLHCTSTNWYWSTPVWSEDQAALIQDFMGVLLWCFGYLSVVCQDMLFARHLQFFSNVTIPYDWSGESNLSNSRELQLQVKWSTHWYHKS